MVPWLPCSNYVQHIYLQPDQPCNLAQITLHSCISKRVDIFVEYTWGPIQLEKNLHENPHKNRHENSHENPHELPIKKLQQKNQGKVVRTCLLFKLDFREDFHENFREDLFPIESGP